LHDPLRLDLPKAFALRVCPAFFFDFSIRDYCMIPCALIYPRPLHPLRVCPAFLLRFFNPGLLHDPLRLDLPRASASASRLPGLFASIFQTGIIA